MPIIGEVNGQALSSPPGPDRRTMSNLRGEPRVAKTEDQKTFRDLAEISNECDTAPDITSWMHTRSRNGGRLGVDGGGADEQNTCANRRGRPDEQGEDSRRAELAGDEPGDFPAQRSGQPCQDELPRTITYPRNAPLNREQDGSNKYLETEGRQSQSAVGDDGHPKKLPNGDGAWVRKDTTLHT